MQWVGQGVLLVYCCTAFNWKFSLKHYTAEMTLPKSKGIDKNFCQ